MTKRSILVIGLGRFGVSTATTLANLGHEVVVVDQREEYINAVKDTVLHAMQADTTDERVLERLGVRNFDVVVICIGDDLRASILTTVLCRELGARTIIAKASDALHAKLLEKTGADRVVQPELDGGVRLARSISSKAIIDTLDLSDGHSIAELRVPKSWIGKTLVGLNARVKYGINVIAIRHGGHVMDTVNPDLPLNAEDTLFVIGSNASIEKLENR
ncbi:MAG: TrkA family potassium uptake protein [Christensenellales bacterium]|jgi:trk system potassium uptake protein TrkA|uniref:TrkA family potassium uptake protein n=1 Tax=Candidatus Avichristensenella intestinipullorum TaxID=2840693 RepID=A0A9D0YYW1_9FIRM|nr:TrkA family potassium uptake protein [Christensenellales bacterium]HIQ63390.1 TrkA family potassium uptake protein [Candidatus Avichristensenella intestinipullorum]